MSQPARTIGAMYDDRIDPRALANLPRRVPGGHASFGALMFPFRRAVRRADETVVVEMDGAVRPDALVDLFEAAAQHGPSQLCLGSTICRAKPVAWEPAVRTLVFELA
jgi:hypothetical protein